jgi:DTW domain-containing protein YfiP
VVILQHPREARLAICSAWLTHLALPNSELHRGVSFEEDARVRAAVAVPGAALLFPGEGAVPAEARAEAPPPVLVAVDGTWHQAEKMLRANPALAALPRVSVAPDRPGGYGGLRREPAAHCLSTLEAVALALGALERDPARFEPMREAFRRMVAAQLACARGERRSPRHRPQRRDRSV